MIHRLVHFRFRPFWLLGFALLFTAIFSLFIPLPFFERNTLGYRYLLEFQKFDPGQDVFDVIIGNTSEFGKAPAAAEPEPMLIIKGARRECLL